VSLGVAATGSKGKKKMGGRQREEETNGKKDSEKKKKKVTGNNQVHGFLRGRVSDFYQSSRGMRRKGDHLLKKKPSY